MSEWLFQRHNRERLNELAANGSAVLIPLAATEQHGLDLPVFTDSLISERICQDAMEAAGLGTRLLLAPTVTIGCSQHHIAFGGTISYSSATYASMLRDIGNSLVASGFRKLIFLNSHGGNEHIMQQTAADLAATNPIWTAAASYWSISRAALSQGNADAVGPVPGHAGGFEASLIKAIRPDWVSEITAEGDNAAAEHPSVPWIQNALPGTFIGTQGTLTGFDGYTDASHLATAAHGEACLAIIAQEVSRWLVNTVEAMEAS